MDEYLEWLIGKIEFERGYVAKHLNLVLDGKQRFSKESFEEASHRYQAFMEARAQYEEYLGKKSEESA